VVDRLDNDVCCNAVCYGYLYTDRWGCYGYDWIPLRPPNELSISISPTNGWIGWTYHLDREDTEWTRYPVTFNLPTQRMQLMMMARLKLLKYVLISLKTVSREAFYLGTESELLIRD
jgi:hypothetical protein